MIPGLVYILGFVQGLFQIGLKFISGYLGLV